MEMFLFWMGGALICGQVFKILSLPILIGFIFSGFLFKYFNFADVNGLLNFPSKIGVELLLFSIGLKVKPSAFLNFTFLKVFFIHAAVVSFVYFFLINLNVNLEVKVLLCIALTFSSTIVASKSLEDRQEMNSFHGRISILILIFQDILALTLLLYTSSNNLSFNTLYLLFIPLIIPILKKFLIKLETSEELELLASVLIALLLGGYLFEKLGLTGEIGALILGMLLSNYKRSQNLAEKIWSLREILLLAFFISLGMKLNLSFEIVSESLIIIMFLIIKLVVLFFLLILVNLRAYSSFLISISLLTYSEFSLILLAHWLEIGIVDNSLFGVLVCSVSLSFIIGSILNKYIHEIYVMLEKYLVKFEREKHHPDEQPHTCGEAQVMIVGMGRIGNAIFENLSKNNIKVVGFDANTDLSLDLLKQGKRVSFADAEDPGFWSKLRFGKLTTIILALPEFHAQNWSVKQARKYGFKGRIIVPTRSQGNPDLLKSSGADEIYDAYDAAGIGVTESFLRHNE